MGARTQGMFRNAPTQNPSQRRWLDHGQSTRTAHCGLKRRGSDEASFLPCLKTISTMVQRQIGKRSRVAETGNTGHELRKAVPYGAAPSQGQTQQRIHRPGPTGAMLLLKRLSLRFRQQFRVISGGKVLLVLFVVVGVVQRSTVGNSRKEPALSSDPTYPLLIAPPIIRHNMPGDQIWRDAAYQTRPRVMGFYFRDSRSSSWIGGERLEPNLKRRLTPHHDTDMTKDQVQAQLHLDNSRDYDYGRQDPLEEGECRVQYEWQKQSFPNCNTVHEQDLGDLQSDDDDSVPVRLLANGYWRDVWQIRVVDHNKSSDTLKYALKTMRYTHEYEERNYDRHRRDAVAMMRLSKSRYIVDIYAFCGNSGINEFATGGDIEDLLWYSDSNETLTPEIRLVVAHQAAVGLSHVHTLAGDASTPAIAHTDITGTQFVSVNGIYKLNDFNRARFILWNTKEDETCTFHVGNNPGTFRAPEEYKYDRETEKIDVYSLGNVLFCLLTDEYPFEHEEDRVAQDLVMRGRRPSIATRLRHSNETAHMALLKAMDMCWKQDPLQRASAKEVADYLGDELDKLGPIPGTASLSLSEDN